METVIQGGAWPGMHQGQTKKEGAAINLARQLFIVPSLLFLGLVALYHFVSFVVVVVSVSSLLPLAPPSLVHLYLYLLCFPFTLMKMKKK